MSLVLKLRPGEVIIINGAPLRFRTRACIELTAQARFMFGKQVMSPDQANSPARRIYFALQSAYIGEETEREAGLESARHFIEEFQRATTSEVARQLLTRALVAAESDELPESLKLARRVMQHEDAVIGNPPPEPQRFEATLSLPYQMSLARGSLPAGSRSADGREIVGPHPATSWSSHAARCSNYRWG